jgi:hypothetical protein
MLFAFAGCDTNTKEDETTTTQKVKTQLPADITSSVNEEGETITMSDYTPEQLEANSDKIFAYFLDQSKELATAKAAVSIGLSKGITKSTDENGDSIPFSENDTLNAAVKTLSNYMLITGTSQENPQGYVGTEKGQVVVLNSGTEYGEKPLAEVLPLEHLASLTRAEVKSATCKDEGPLRIITITLNDASTPETVEKIYPMGDKAAVLAELATAKDYMTVTSDPVLSYDNCQMIVTVNIETDEITAIEYIKRINVTTSVVGAGTLAGLEETPVNFCYESFLKYELDRNDPNAPVTEAQ